MSDNRQPTFALLGLAILAGILALPAPQARAQSNTQSNTGGTLAPIWRNEPVIGSG